MARDAVNRARESSPDLVLVDIQMPRLDGYGVLRELRADPRLSGLRVVALTAFAMQGDRERALRRRLRWLHHQARGDRRAAAGNQEASR